jgi:hypothetical protein
LLEFKNNNNPEIILMEQKNNLDWELYEHVTKYIYETLGKEYNVKVEGYGRECKILGDSGVYHQVDVLTSESDGDATCKTAIECKYLKKKVDKDIVMKLLSIINDTDVNRGIIVSKSGFTRDAKKFAEHNNINIVHLREVGEQDNHVEKEMEIALIDFVISTHLTRPEITAIQMEDDNGEKSSILEKDQYQIIIENSNGYKIKLFDAVMVFKRHLHSQKPFKLVSEKYDYSDHTIYFNDTIKKIKSITFTGLLTEKNEAHQKAFTLTDRVWLIMKSIFERQMFTISEYGIIAVSKDENLL